MTGFGQTLLDPLAAFAQSIEAASTLEEIRNLENSQTKISELNVLTKKLSHLGSRVSWAEQQAQKVKELEMMNRISRQVAHDIRSPLTAIEVITKSEGILDPQKLNLLKMASEQIKGIADDLLRRNKGPGTITGSEESTTPVPFKGRISLEDAISTIETLLESKKIEHSSQNIRFSLYQDISCSKDFYCRATDLSRILSNLINNSVEAMPEGGLITMDIAADADRCMIEVRDTGRGVASENLERIFLEGASFGKAEGSGLGLYHAKVLIESWGGQIFFNSELNRGTTVKIALKPVR
jgi:signal transduction histidine kinase